MNVESGLRIRHLSPAFRTFCGEAASMHCPGNWHASRPGGR